MSITGLDLRNRLRRRIVRGLDQVIALLESEPEAPKPDVAPEPAPPAPKPAPAPVEAAPTPAPVKKAAAPAPPPLPDIPKTLKPLPKSPASGPAPSAKAAPAKAAPTPTPAAPKKQRLSAEERQARHRSRTRRGVLRFVSDQGGSAKLREMHDYSEATFFVAHVGFSRLMEELTDEGLLDFDHDTATATLTDAGRSALA